jgi:HK97 family phage major capsid protein
MTIKQLNEKRKALVAQSRAMVERAASEKRSMTEEENANYDKIFSEIGELRTQVDRLSAIEAQEAELNQRSGDPLDADDAQPQGEKRGDLRSSDEYRNAFSEYLRTGNMNHAEARAVLQADSDTGGGYFLPTTNTNNIIQALDNQLFFRQLATVIQVNNANSVGAVSLDADPADGEWTGEISSTSLDSTMAFGRRELKPNLIAKRIKISQKLLRNLPTIESFVQERLAYKLAVPMENAFFNGTGAGQPLGVFTASVNGIPSSATYDIATDNTSTAITADGLKNCKYSLAAQYRRGASWIFHRDAIKRISKLTDGLGGYLWQSGLAAGDPDRLLGLPVYESEYVPNTFTANLYVGILGDFSQYYIAESLAMSVQRLTELYAETSQVGYIIRAEVDGMPALPAAFRRVTLGS